MAKEARASERPCWNVVGCSSTQALSVWLGFPAIRLACKATVQCYTPSKWRVEVGQAFAEGEEPTVQEAKAKAEAALIGLLDEIKALVLRADRNRQWWER